MFAVTAQIIVREGNWEYSTGVPTFYLQNILNEEHAVKIAKAIILPVPNPSVIDIHVCAVKLF